MWGCGLRASGRLASATTTFSARKVRAVESASFPLVREDVSFNFSFPSTMITTERLNDTQINTTPAVVLIDTTKKAKQTTWSQPKRHLALIKSWLLRRLLCVSDEMLDEIEEECAVRDAIRENMIVHNVGSGLDAITQCMSDVYESTQYDMANFSNQDCGAPQPSNTVQEIVFGEFEPIQLECELPVVNKQQPHEARVVPKFAAALVTAMRAKFGKLSPSEANRLLIEREYLKVCRDVHVRNVDIEMHRQFVVNAFFTEGITDQLATTRTRLPKWLREAFGSVPIAEPTIC